MRGIHIPRNNGFTLVEIIISIVLLGILAAVGSSMISDSFNTTRMVDADQASRAQSRYAIERLAREIREIKFVRDGAGLNGQTNYTGYCIDTNIFSASSLAFNKPASGDLDRANCATNITTVSITGGSSVMLVSSTLASKVITNPNGDAFLRYYLANGTEMVSTPFDPSLVRFVVITLTTRDSGPSITERTRVALRDY